MISTKGNLPSHSSDNGMGTDLTPLIDIIFIVLVFLLLTANAPLLSLKVDVPTTPNANLAPITNTQHIDINVLPQAPYWTINGHHYNHWSEFEAEFQTAITETPKANIIIAADKAAQIQPLMSVLSLLQKHEISHTQVIMNNGN